MYRDYLLEAIKKHCLGNFQAALETIDQVHEDIKKNLASYPKEFIQKDNYRKNNFFVLENDGFALCTSLIEFNEKSFTKVHSHPEYIVESFLQGSLNEKIYKKCHEDSSCKLFSEKIYNEGQKKKYFDPQGSPHSVKAVKNTCLILITCFGKEAMRYVKTK